MDALPLLPLRDCAVLPGCTRELVVGRPATLAMLDQVGLGGQLLTAAQRTTAQPAWTRAGLSSRRRLPVLKRNHTIELQHNVDPGELTQVLVGALSNAEFRIQQTGAHSFSAENQRVVLSGKESGVYATGVIQVAVNPGTVRATYDLMGLRVIYPFTLAMSVGAVGIVAWSGQYVHLWVFLFLLWLPFLHRRAHSTMRVLLENSITKVAFKSPDQGNRGAS